MEKYMPYDLGLFVGRFEHFHKGHENVVNTALKLCNRLVILISDADIKISERNPFSIDIREKLIKEIYSDKQVIVGRIDKFKNADSNIDFRKYVLEQASKITDDYPQFIIYGTDVTFNPWYDTRGIKDMVEIIVPRSEVEISATEIRRYLLDDNKEEWEKYTNTKIHKYYNELRNELLKLKK